MTDKKILVLDIDGTLVNSEKKITPETLKYLKMIQEQGHIVALASGRPFPGLKQYSDALGLAEYGGYALSFNGGKVISCATQEVIYTKATRTVMRRFSMICEGTSHWYGHIQGQSGDYRNRHRWIYEFEALASIIWNYVRSMIFSRLWISI